MIFTFFLLAPIVFALLIYCRHKEYVYDENKKKKCNDTDNTSETYPTLNERKGSKKPIKLKEKKEQTKLQSYLEKHGKQLALYMTEKDAFLIPIQACGEIADELEEWFNNHATVDYAILETDGIHVKMNTQ